MAINDVATALDRATSVLRRRPSAGIHDDAPGRAVWLGGVRTETSHAAGHKMLTDMPPELGGTGDQVSPGWMVRSGVAACTATAIASLAALDGVELDTLEVTVTSRSDVRGYLGLTEEDGASVYPGPAQMQMHVRIAAKGVGDDQLRALVAKAQDRAPMTAVVRDARVMPTQIEVDNG